MAAVEEVDVIIIGAGVAGSAMAWALGKQGRRVVALERDLNQPDRIVGELLQPGGVASLTALGLEHCIEEIDGQAIQGYVVMRGEEHISLTYPNNVLGIAFHHGRFVQNLRKAAATLTPHVELRQAIAMKLLEATGDEASTQQSTGKPGGQVIGVEYKPSGMKELRRIYAPVTIVSDGCFSKFRTEVVDSQPIGKSHFVGTIARGVTLPVPNRGHVVLVDPAPVLMYPISPNEVRILVDVPNPLPDPVNGELARYLSEKIAPQLPAGVQQGFVTAVTTERLRTMPNNRLHPEKFVRKGLIVIGDAFNMRHPLTGGGMTVALNDVQIISDGLSKLRGLDDVDAVAKIYERWHADRLPRASTINVLAQALYEVFSASADPALKDMREACFNYFKLGGLAVSGPMGLLSGLSESPRQLLAHFFSVALYGAGQQLLPFPFPSGIARAYSVVKAATKVVVPLLEKEGLISPTSPVERLVAKL